MQVIQEIQETFKNTPPPSVSSNQYNVLEFAQDETNNLIYRFNIDLKTLTFSNNNNLIEYILIEDGDLRNFVEIKIKLVEIIKERISSTLKQNGVDNVIKNIEYILSDELNILLTVILFSEEERAGDQSLIKFNCFICFDDKEEKKTKYCSNNHSVYMCNVCYNLLLETSYNPKCSICRNNLYMIQEAIDTPDLLGNVFRIKNDIYYEIKKYNEFICGAIERQYIKINNKFFRFPIHIIDITEDKFPFIEGLNAEYIYLKNSINNLYICNHIQYKELEFLVLCIILKSFLSIPEPKDIEDEAGNIKKFYQTVGIFFKIYSEELNEPYSDSKLIITSSDFTYKNNKILDIYNIYNYFIACINKYEEDDIKKYYIEIVKDLTNNQKSKPNQYNFKYNNKKYTINNIKARDEITVYICKKICEETKKGKKYSFDDNINNIIRIDLNILSYDEVYNEFYEEFRENFYNCNYDFFTNTNDNYPFSSQMHEHQMTALQDAPAELINEFFTTFLENNLQFRHTSYLYIENNDDLGLLMRRGNMNYYIKGIYELSEILVIDGSYYLTDR